MCLDYGLKQWPSERPARVKPGRVFWKVFALEEDGQLYPCYQDIGRSFKPDGEFQEALDFSRTASALRVLYFEHPEEDSFGTSYAYMEGFHCYMYRGDAEDLQMLMRDAYGSPGALGAYTFIILPVALEGVRTMGIWKQALVVVADKLKVLPLADPEDSQVTP
jgi:hypothetical protein